jgi:ribosome biogenesis GTPase
MNTKESTYKMDIQELGWNDFFAALFDPYARAGKVPARVIKQDRDRSIVACGAGELGAVVTGRFRHTAAGRSGYPAVGDWVAVEELGGGRAAIHAVLERRSAFVRKAAGDSTEAQVVAANIDNVFLVTGLDGDYNLRRVERYLTAAWDSGAAPVVVLNKADLRTDLEGIVAEVGAVALGTPVAALSALDGSGLEALAPFLPAGRTVALLGSSGAGKSTLVNRLLGEDRQLTGPVRAGDGRGRHTTSRRELIKLPGGALLIDTPGMRELQLWAEEEESLGRTFDDIERLAPACRFSDCRHGDEPGCAVRSAVESGLIEAGRLASFLKQREELERLAVKRDARSRRQAEKAFGRKIAAVMKDVKLRKPGL